MKITEKFKEYNIDRGGYKYVGAILDRSLIYENYRNGTTELQILKDEGEIKDCTSDSFVFVAVINAKNDPNKSIVVTKEANDDSKLFICSKFYNFSLSIGDDGKICIYSPTEERYIYCADDECGVYYNFMQVLDEGNLTLGSGIRIDDNIDALFSSIHDIILKGLKQKKINTRNFEELFEVLETILTMCIIDYLERKLTELKAKLEVELDEEHAQMLTEIVNSLSTNIENAIRKLQERTKKA